MIFSIQIQNILTKNNAIRKDYVPKVVHGIGQLLEVKKYVAFQQQGLHISRVYKARQNCLIECKNEKENYFS